MPAGTCRKVEAAPARGPWRRLDQALGTERWRAVICFSLFLTYLLCFAPGGMSPDTTSQYKEALEGIFYNWHPPIMAVVWRVLFFFQQGPLPMLCFQLLMLFGACWLLSGLGAKKGAAQWYWLFLPLLPQVYCVTGMIWKDVEQAFAFFLAFALYARSVEEKSSASLVIAAFFTLYGLLLRHNSICALFAPVFLLSFWHCRYKNFLARTVVALCLLCGLVVFSTYVNKLLTNDLDRTNAWTQLFDEIGATSHVVGKNLFLPELDLSQLPLERIPPVQVGESWTLHRYGNAKNVTPDIWYKNILWIIRNYPLQYLRAKWNLFLHFNSFPFKYKPIWSFYITKKEHVKAITEWSLLRKILEYPIILSHSWKIGDQYPLEIFFLPILWMPLGVLLGIAALRVPDTQACRSILLLVSSGIGYYFSWFLVCSTPDYRYILWPNLSVIAALVVWLRSAWNQRRTAL